MNKSYSGLQSGQTVRDEGGDRREEVGGETEKQREQPPAIRGHTDAYSSLHS